MHTVGSRTGFAPIWRLVLSIAMLAALALTAPPPQVAHAATIDVTTTDDELNSDSDCSLREAIEAANTNAAVDACTAGSLGMDTINLPAGTYTLSITGTGEDANQTGDLDILDDLTIVGDGAESTTIDANGIDRVLHLVPADPELTIIYLDISGVTITGGDLTADAACFTSILSIDGGGGICTGGLATVLTVADSVITDNTVPATTAMAGGGGIMAVGSVSLDNCTVSYNSVPGETYGLGGGLFAFGTMDVVGSTFNGNWATQGGAIGLIGYFESSPSTLVNSTLSGNSAMTGGGLATMTGGSYSYVTLTNSTVTKNAAFEGGAGIYNGGGTVELKNTIVAEQIVGSDCYGTITSLQYNIDSDNTCNLTLLGDQPSTDPLLGSLQNNGGPTLTHELLAGSPARDGVADTYCTVTTDQRGASRPVDGDDDGTALCDIGSFEADAPVQIVELAIEKSGQPNPVYAGEELVYNIAVTNNGTATADPVVVVDTLPAEVSYQSDTGGCAVIDTGPPEVLQCDVGPLGPSETFLFEITVLVSPDAAPGLIFNSATVNDEVTDTTSTLVRVPIVDLAIEKTDSPDPVMAGQELFYELVVSNEGQATATGVTVTDTLPVEVEYLDNTDNCTGPDVSNRLICSLPDLPGGASHSFDIKVALPPDAVVTEDDGTIAIANVADVGSDEDDTNLINNSATEGTFVEELADLSVVKMSKPDIEVRAGEQFTYTIVVDNWGPSAARNIVVTDTLIAEGWVQANGCSLSIRTEGGLIDEFNCNFALATGIFDLSVMGANWLMPRSPLDQGRAIITINATADDGTDLNNLVTVTSETPDPDMSNNSSWDVLYVGPVADLGIDKTWEEAPPEWFDGAPFGFEDCYLYDEFSNLYGVRAGCPLRFQIGVDNAGPSLAENVVVEDVMPAGVTVEGVGPSQGSCTTGIPGDPSAPLTCNLGNILAGQGAAIEVFAMTHADLAWETLENDALVYSDIFDPDNGNNRSHVLIWAEPFSYLSLDKEGPEEIMAGEEIEYWINLWNEGPSTAHGVYLDDELPGGVSLLSAQVMVGEGSCQPDSTLCSLGDMEPGDSRGVRVRGYVEPWLEAGTIITNTVRAWAESPFYQPVPEQPISDTWESLVNSTADLSITKTADPYKVYAGEQIQYDVSVTNNGPGMAYNVLVTDTFDPGVEYEIDTAGCTVLTETQTVLLGSSQPFFFDGDEPGALFAIDPGASSASLIGAMTGGWLATELEYDFLSGKLYAAEADGDPWLHNIDANTGATLDAVDIDGSDNVPGLEFVGSTLYGALGGNPSHLVTIDPATGAVTDIGSTGIYEPLSGLAYDESTSTMYGVTAGGDWAHLVTIDLGTGWATEVGYIEVDGYYVERVGSIEFGPDGKLYGGFTWNAYPDWLGLDYDLIEIDLATGEATQLFDTGFSITGLTLSEITVPVGLECSLGDIAPGETSTFSMWARVKPETLGLISNRVDVMSDTEDPNPDNDWDTESSLVLGKADLKVTKFGKPDGVVRAGEDLQYTVLVDNLGTGYAHDVVLYDEITSSDWEWYIEEWESNRPASCTETYDYYGDSTTLTCRLLDPLEAMSPTSSGRWILKVYVEVYERMSINNVARVVSSDFDPDLSNNEAIVEHEITAVADLNLDKEAWGEIPVGCEGETDFWADEVAAGGTLQYVLEIDNNGPSEAENVVVEDWGLSPFLDIVDVECIKEDDWDECSCVTTELGELGDENRRLKCYLGTMGDGDEDLVLITARIPSDVPEGIDLLRNDAWVYSEVFDDYNGDNLATNWTTVSRWADLEVIKTQDPEIALPTLDVTYTITVTNLGPSNAEGVFVSDTVPVQVLNPTWTCCVSGDGECDVPCEPPTCPVEPCPWPDIGLYAQADIPAGEWAIYTVSGTLDFWPCSSFTNTVEVIAPQSLLHPEMDIDPCDDNNTDFVVNEPLCHYDPLVLKDYPSPDSTP